MPSHELRELDIQIAGAMAEFEANLARERVQAGVDAARVRGVRLGRPRASLTAQRARMALDEHGSIRKAARALGVSPSLVARRLRDDRELQSAGT